MGDGSPAATEAGAPALRGARGKRAQARELRRQGVLDVADRLFSERGYHGVSLDELAEAAGVSKPGLYAYFGSKDGLYVEALRRAADMLAERIAAAVAAAGDPEEGGGRGI